MSNLKLPLKIAITGGLALWLVLAVDWGRVGGILIEISPAFVIGYIIVQLLGNVISAAKWQYLARLQGFSFSLFDGFMAYLSGAFINNFLPSTVGGDAYRVLWLARSGDRLRAFTVVFFDRLTGLLALFLLAGIGLLSFPLATILAKPGLIIFAAITLSVVCVIVIALFFAARLYRGLEQVMTRLPWKKPSELFGGLATYAKNRVYGATLVWSLGFTVIGIGLSNYLLFRSLGIELPIGVFFNAIFAATLVANIPISINNIGVKEWSYIFFFGLVGVSVEVAVTAALLSRVLQMLISFLALPSYLAAKRVEHVRHRQ